MAITLVELTEMLRSEHGAEYAMSAILRFLDRHPTERNTAYAEVAKARTA